MSQTLPYLIEPKELAQHLDDENIRIVDLSQLLTYQQGHIKNAIHIPYEEITAVKLPAMSVLPEESALSETLSNACIAPTHHVVAYDAEGSGRASRLLWTLDIVGHQQVSLLNGGLLAWLTDNLPVTQDIIRPPKTQYSVSYQQDMIADKDYILRRLNDANVILLDARSPDEYFGITVRGARGGHIPGAVNFDWQRGTDQRRAGRLKDAKELKQKLYSLGIQEDKEIIT